MGVRFVCVLLLITGLMLQTLHAEEYWDDEDDAFFAEIEAEYAAAPSHYVADPFEPFNRGMFVVNDRLYFWVLKPAATGWQKVTPSPVRTGIRNFFRNIGAPVRVTNQLLQGKGKAAAAETGKFFVNSIWGIFGLIDASQQLPSLQVPPEDLGQTLGKWGIGNGFYLVLPFFGPTTLRDGVGQVGDFFLHPTTYASGDARGWTAVKATDTINATSFRLGDYEAIKDASLDPYIAVRNGYIQMRMQAIRQ
ncbi:phospholipid-binding lipoprotein MlaA [Desulfobotulus alkaliphilus]|uniref:Phospholipid-binding lipoprotein MlaA n=1 Tax=Desulfobotulus alkaliphilus TaxID=622671 RepID=A0A562RD06_9BACT|nr:VacJ family lipoprotein [Desulfobotulus alkaliphilus]TWI66935.1 phospholipid-binding lipoprotein MlaA [Desulfobotulus alkaliphilus]